MKNFIGDASPVPLESETQREPWPVSLCFLPLSGCGQEDELGHEEDILSVEGPGPGGDQYCSSVQLPGSARARLPAARPQGGN